MTLTCQGHLGKLVRIANFHSDNAGKRCQIDPSLLWDTIGKPYIGSATDQPNSLLDDLEMSKVVGRGLQHVAYSDQTVLDRPIVTIEH